MSIASITTLGFGAFSTVNYAVVLGYNSNLNPPPVVQTDTHDYPLDYLKKHWARLKKQEAALRSREKEKLEQAKQLRNQIYGIEEIIKSEAVEETKESISLPQIDNQSELLEQLAIYETELKFIANQIILLQAQRAEREDEDIRAVLLLM